MHWQTLIIIIIHLSVCNYYPWIQKVFTPLYLLNTLLFCGFDSELIQLTFLSGNFFWKIFENQKIKYLIHRSIQTLYSILYRSLFGSNYSYTSSCTHHYKLLTPGSQQFIPFFRADPLRLRHTGRWVSVNCVLQVSPQMFDGVKSGFCLDHSGIFRDLLWSHSCAVLSVLYVSGHCRVEMWTVTPVWVCVHSRGGFLQDDSVFGCIHPSTVTSLPVPDTEKHLYSMMLPPPFFTVGMILTRWCLVHWLFFVRYSICCSAQRVTVLSHWTREHFSTCCCHMTFTWQSLLVIFSLCHEGLIYGLLQRNLGVHPKGSPNSAQEFSGCLILPDGWGRFRVVPIFFHFKITMVTVVLGHSKP